jgi:hypothetical protein
MIVNHPKHPSKIYEQRLPSPPALPVGSILTFWSSSNEGGAKYRKEADGEWHLIQEGNVE